MPVDLSPFGIYCICVAAVAGLCMGSFLNCLAWRATHDESVFKGRSHCTTCGHVLGPLDLIPVFSWLSTKGKCRYCGERVSGRYPATELFCALGYVSILIVYGISLEMVELLFFFSVLLVLSLTDLDDYIIPNATILAALIIRAVYAIAAGAMGQASTLQILIESLVGGLAVGIPIVLLALVMDKVLGRDSLGGGDVKLLFVAGCYFGWQQCLFLIVLACVLGIVFALVSQRTARAAKDGKAAAGLIPFGPAIAAACWITMLVGNSVVTWYLSLFYF